MKVIESTQQYYELLIDLCSLEEGIMKTQSIENYQKSTSLEENKSTVNAEIAV